MYLVEKSKSSLL